MNRSPPERSLPRKQGRMFRFRTLAVVTSMSAAALFALSACSSGAPGSTGSGSAPAAGSVTFAGYGGSAGDAITKEWLTPFTKSTGIPAALDPTMDSSKLTQMVKSGSVTWDAAEAGLDYNLTASNSNLVNIDCKVVSCTDFTGAWKAMPKGVPMFIYSTTLAYNTSKVKSAPTDWSAFFDIKKYPGKRILSSGEGFYGILEAALLSDGVPRASLYPLDVPRALKVLSKIKSSIIYATDSQQCVDSVSSGESVMGACYNGRVTLAQKAGKPIAQVWNQQIQSADYLVIPKGSQNVASAMKFIAYVTSKAHAGDLANAIAYGPANPLATVSASVKADVPTSNESNGVDAPIIPNWRWWNANRASVLSTVTQWVAQ